MHDALLNGAHVADLNSRQANWVENQPCAQVALNQGPFIYGTYVLNRKLVGLCQGVRNKHASSPYATSTINPASDIAPFTASKQATPPPLKSKAHASPPLTMLMQRSMSFCCRNIGCSSTSLMTGLILQTPTDNWLCKQQ